jgi:hypothetical protein
MTNLNALTDYIQEFCKEVQALESQYGIRITIDHATESLMLVNIEKPSEVVSWLGVDTVQYNDDYINTDNEALTKLVDVTELEEE